MERIGTQLIIFQFHLVRLKGPRPLSRWTPVVTISIPPGPIEGGLHGIGGHLGLLLQFHLVRLKVSLLLPLSSLMLHFNSTWSD